MLGRDDVVITEFSRVLIAIFYRFVELFSILGAVSYWSSCIFLLGIMWRQDVARVDSTSVFCGSFELVVDANVLGIDPRELA